MHSKKEPMKANLGMDLDLWIRPQGTDPDTALLVSDYQVTNKNIGFF
jgi:hypothetical protein